MTDATHSKRGILRRLLAHRKHLVAYGRGVLRGHPGVRIGRGVKLGGPGERRFDRGVTLTSGVQIWVGPGAVLTMRSGSKIGDRSIVNVQSSVVIEQGTRISWDVQILDTDFHWLADETGRRRSHTRPIVLGPRALIGARSMVLKGVEVGAGAVVGAGSVVRRSVEPGSIVVGNPALPVGAVSDWGSAV
ncbi:acyltransferase [Microbacterium sp. zg.Y1090]|uniref:acyltransferase n=1 Tax=Microbacterium TaxID=33882 RepID=UPI00214CC897|nr:MULTISPECIES: DapH/DapD/GlmU-related protein [unclassified Microbacterium]MCR2814125.1 acyltransferase [Microbacterium sp. zg.Y1084]MCR2817870.1 acyltransferase [Microbacterium sp. zg.Y1090]MDL5487724.1 DapH/DapD/GlmU-related protein [Microbacterium sp. zg-Y1211]WIM27960.1 DapH/DapD/GlmU-related protein [Microbacterium sp. zg-Y1090]